MTTTGRMDDFPNISEADFKLNVNMSKLSDDIHRGILNSKDTINTIGKQIGVAGSLLNRIKNNQYKGTLKIETFKKLCNGFNLKWSDYIQIKEKDKLEEKIESIAETSRDNEIMKGEIDSMSINKERVFKLNYGGCLSEINSKKITLLMETVDNLASINTDFDFNFTIKTK
ncbi:MAG: hypothetical protein WC123_04215 [Bacilli bacterium]